MDNEKAPCLITNSTLAGERVVREHCYVEHNTKTMIYYHLDDHNYFINRRPQKTKKVVKPARKRKIKITELRAVYNCKSCGYRTMNREIFSKHSCPQQPLKFIPCTKCDRSQTPDGYEKCPECTYFTKNKSSLKIHMRIHAKGKPYKCTECDFKAKDLKDLIIHYEEEKDLFCECGYSTHVKTQLRVHKRSHTGEKPFCCGVCNYSTSDRAGLHRHLKKHES